MEAGISMLGEENPELQVTARVIGFGQAERNGAKGNPGLAHTVLKNPLPSGRSRISKNVRPDT